jgi:predicted ArsR family transcriptional regulator
VPAKHQKKPRLIDERLVTALSHETRAHALAVFTERPASTKELAQELGESVSAVWYHVDKLLKLGCVELVETKERRGAHEHFYRATVRHFFDAEAWESVSKPKRLTITMGVLRLIAGDLDEAVQGKTVDAVDRHLSRTLLTFDMQGWAESNALLDDTLERLLEIREKAAMRMAETGEEPVRASVSIMHFQLPPRKAAP